MITTSITGRKQSEAEIWQLLTRIKLLAIKLALTEKQTRQGWTPEELAKVGSVIFSQWQEHNECFAFYQGWCELLDEEHIPGALQDTLSGDPAQRPDSL